MEFRCEYINTSDINPDLEDTFDTIIASLEEETELKGITDRNEECYLLGNVSLKDRKGEERLSMDALFICRRFAVVIDFEDVRDYVTGKADKPGMTPAGLLDECQTRLLERIDAWNRQQGATVPRQLTPWQYTAGIVAFTNCPKEGPLPEEGCRSTHSIILRSRDTKFAHAFWSLTCQANESKDLKAFWDKPEEEWLFRSDEDLRAFLKGEGIVLKCWNEHVAPVLPLPEKPQQEKPQPKEKPVAKENPQSQPKEKEKPKTVSAKPRRPAVIPQNTGISGKKDLNHYLIFVVCALVVLLLLFLVGPKACRESQGTQEGQETQAAPGLPDNNQGTGSPSPAGQTGTPTTETANPQPNLTPAVVEQLPAGSSDAPSQSTEELEKMQANLLVVQARLASAYLSAGDNLIKDVRKIGSLKGRNNLQAVKEIQRDMTLQAIECYKNAAAAGNTAASRKQAEAQRMYESYK